MADWGTAGIQSFTNTQHPKLHTEILPSRTRLPGPYVVCIVGASSGIGAGIATAFAEAGASDLILVRNKSPLNETSAQCKNLNPNCTVTSIECDIADVSSVEILTKTISSTHHRLDAVIVNSGYSGPVTLDVAVGHPSIFRSVTDTNYLGTYHLAHFLIPLLLTSPTSGHSPKAFLAVGSSAGFLIRGPIANTQYCVSKLAQLKLIEHIHEQYEDRGVFAAAVHPGAVMSRMGRETAPKEFLPFMTDDPALCGGFMTWLLRPRPDGERLSWLGGRHLVANWDVEELLSRKEEVIVGDLLKVKLAL